MALRNGRGGGAGVLLCCPGGGVLAGAGRPLAQGGQGRQGGARRVSGQALTRETVLDIRIRRIRMFFGLPDPDPVVRGPDSSHFP